ncbi:MAG: cob(I)yrinic acid a,c-diamide adenosyltransferase [Verrucomicrobia bacterium]|nr:cob(I)yrinic acid a,c-diamide adenosyltransferase [Verrucomicrobiota bacterium]MCF7707399.1 cob(I)yrinic acid a,c-diamide adenosyltransferase [Verrucomicrobiota bacterium]
MSIVTKKGDTGFTQMMYGRRVPKSHPRMEACGAVDELNSVLGFARAFSEDASVGAIVFSVQRELVLLMGELATAGEELRRYAEDGYLQLSVDSVERIEKEITGLESGCKFPAGWVIPGACRASAAFDVARSVCRRAERRVSALCENNQVSNDNILRYLNRLSDLLWLLARREEFRIEEA